MSAQGGWSRWWHTLACGGLASALGALWLTGCGGRTSALDPDVYGSPTDTGDEGGSSGTSAGGRGGSSSSSGGKPSAGGKPTGAGGNGPSAGGSTAAGGSGGFDPTLAIAPCQAYCPGYGTQCAERLMGQDCVKACLLEVNRSGARCQKLGIKTLQCLTPFFMPNGGDCDGAVSRALERCGATVSDFEECTGVVAPTPPPMSMPTMGPPPLDVTTCLGLTTGNANGCEATFGCSSGPYAVSCVTKGSIASCSCSLPTGETVRSTVANSSRLCYDAARLLCR